MAFLFYILRDASPRFKAVQISQLIIVILTVIFTFFAAVLPLKYKAFTFGLLSSLIGSSITTSILLRREQNAYTAGTLIKSKYVKYQAFKMVAAAGMYFLGFIAFVATSQGEDKRKPGEQGLWMGGVKINRFQGSILWLHTFNWLFLWAGLFYSCCMTGARKGSVRLEGEEAHLGAEDETVNDEEIARSLQVQDPNWRE